MVAEKFKTQAPKKIAISEQQQTKPQMKIQIRHIDKKNS